MNFLGAILVISVAIGIFFMLMSTEMPQSNRELLIAFVSVLFGGMASSIKKITGDDDNDTIKELTLRNKELEKIIKEYESKTVSE